MKCTTDVSTINSTRQVLALQFLNENPKNVHGTLGYTIGRKDGSLGLIENFIITYVMYRDHLLHK